MAEGGAPQDRSQPLVDPEVEPIRLTAGILLLGGLAWCVVSIATLDAPGRVLPAPLGVAVAMAVASVLAGRRPRAAAWLVVLASMGGLGYAIAITEPSDPRFVGALVIPLLLAGLLIGPYALAGAALLAVATRGVLAWHQAQAGASMPFEPLSPLAFWAHTSVLLLTVAAVAGIALRRWQRIAERARRGEGLYRLLADNAGDVIWTLDAEGALVYVSPACERVLGFTAAEQTERYGKGLLVQRPEDDARLAELSAQLRSGERDEFTLEMEQPHASGRLLWCEIHVRSVRDAAGRFRGVVGVTRDLSHRRTMELANARLRQALERADEAIAVIAPDGATEFANRAYAALSPVAELGDGDPRAAIEKLLPEPLQETRDALRRGEPWRHRVERLLEGRKRFLETSVTPVHDADGGGVGLVSVTRDITREVELETEMRQAQKMQALGQLAGGIAHDFNNLIAVIAGYAELLGKRHADDVRTTQDLAEIREAADLAASLTRQLLAAGRRTVADPRPIDVGEAVQRMAGILRSIVREDIELELSFEEGAGLIVEMEPDQLQLVLVNLATNARDAMPDGGRLGIRVRAERAPDAAGCMRDEVVLAVEDTGCGIPESEREQIFEPFFTTKAPGRGTGLGLASVYWAVSRAGGRITLASQRGRGSRFEVRLPRLSGPAASERKPAGESLAANTTGTALIVEDQPLVRSMLRRAIESEGWRVVEADSGAAALALLAQGGAAPDVLLTDVVMPGMSGIALAIELRRRHPDLHVILASGYPPEELSTLGPELAGARFLHKPFQLSQVFTELRGCH